MRFVNISGGGSTAGTVIGTLSSYPAIIEGMEHGPAPHKIGHELFHKGFSYNGAAFSNSGLYTSPENHKFVVTYLSMGVSSTAGSNITFHEGSGTSTQPDRWLFTTYVKVANNDTQTVNANLGTPFVATDKNSSLCLSSDGTASIRGVVHGYYTEK